MARFTRPGVYVEESLRPNVRATARPAEPSAAFIGAALKGPVDGPRLVRSWTEFTALYGSFTAGLPDGNSPLLYAVHSFFANGGSECYILRVADGATTAATITLDDRAGAPLDTLKVDAYSVGTWGNDIHVGIFDRSATTFDIIVYYGGETDSNIVERFTDVSMDPTSLRYVVDVVNSDSTRGSKYIRVTDEESATAAPLDRPALGTFDLAGAVAGAALDDTDWTTAIDLLDQITASFVVAVPGITDTDVINDLVAFVDGRGDAFAVLDSADVTATDAETAAAQVTPATSSAATFWPHVIVNDPASTRTGVTKTIAPSGAVIGAFMRNDADHGPQRTPAGVAGILSNVIGLSQQPTLDQLGDLNEAGVNVIGVFDPASSVAIMGGRTLKLTGPDRYIATRRTLIYLRASITNILKGFQFDENDETLWTEVTSEITSFLSGFWNRGGLRGASTAEAFFVKCDEDINTEATVEDGELHVEVGVSLLYPAEFIVLKIGQYESGAVNIVEESA